MLGEERRQKILERVAPLVAEIDPDVRLLDVLLDSTRTELVFVLQKQQWPLLVGMKWLDYVSHRNDELRKRLAEGLQRRLEVARGRSQREK